MTHKIYVKTILGEEHTIDVDWSDKEKPITQLGKSLAKGGMLYSEVSGQIINVAHIVHIRAEKLNKPVKLQKPEPIYCNCLSTDIKVKHITYTDHTAYELYCKNCGGIKR